MQKVLVLLAHPVLERSRLNRQLAAVAAEVSGVTLHDLYEAYPHLDVDVKREQALLEAHGVVVFQHPLYWYSAPPLVKQWQDLVLEHGWAYGRKGDRLRGKVTLNALTTGGPAAAYRHEGYNRFTLRELLSPFDQTAHLCGMRFLAPFAVQGAFRFEGPEQLQPQREAYRLLLEALRDETLDLEKAAAANTLPDEPGALRAFLKPEAAP